MALEQEINESNIVDMYVKRDEEMSLLLQDQIEQACKKVFPYSIQYIVNYIESTLSKNVDSFLNSYNFSKIYDLFQFESHEDEICNYWSNSLRIKLRKEFKNQIREQINYFVSNYHVDIPTLRSYTLKSCFELDHINVSLVPYLDELSENVLSGKWSDIGPVDHTIKDGKIDDFNNLTIYFDNENIPVYGKFFAIFANYDRAQDLRSSTTSRELYSKMSYDELVYLGY